MNTYIVRRRGIAAGPNELDAAFTRLRAVEEDRALGPRGARWLRSYVLRERDGRYGLACVLLAEGVAALQAHAAATGLPADEIMPLLGRIVFSADPGDAMTPTGGAA